VFDSRNDVVSFDESALLWGEELFNYFRERSKRI
jgi:predicted transcriptional regulator